MVRTASRSWEHLSDRDLLRVRICDLGLSIRDGEIPEHIRQIYEELAARRIVLRPEFYLSDDWFTPDGQTCCAVPFYLTHPRLRALEFRMVFEVEGGTRHWCLRLMRHEVGHAIDHAYGLHRTKQWKRVFGSPSQKYEPELYHFDPRSKAHVRNLPDHYAQSHPEEDFAETFAVWLNPHSQWRTRYVGWPAMRKLRYIERTMRELAGERPRRRRTVPVSEARTLRSTLASYYRRKIQTYQLDDLAFAIPVMKRIFRASRGRKDHAVLASTFIREHKRSVASSITAWSGARRGQVERVLRNLAHLCDEHELIVRDATQALVEISTYAATLVGNHFHTHRFRAHRT